MTPAAKTLDLDELERVAKEAYAGPWQTDGDMVSSLDEYRLGIEEDIVCEGTSTEGNATFIASASPDVVIALVGRIRELESFVRDYRANHYGDTAHDGLTPDSMLLRARQLVDASPIPDSSTGGGT